MINELYKAFKRNKKNNSHIGYLIKKARKENGFTLADASDNICCVSYLSKIENGNINVAPKILEEIKYRLNVSEKYFKTDEEYKNIILDLIKGMCLSDEKKVNHCFSLVDNKDEVFYADIIRMGHSLYFKQIKKAYHYLEQIMMYKDEFFDFELIVVSLFMAILYSLEYKHELALSCLDMTNEFNIKNTYIKEIVYEMKANIYLHKGDISTVMSILDEYHDYALGSLNFKLIKGICLKKIVAISIDNSNKAYELLEKLFLNKKEKSKYRAILNIITNRYEDINIMDDELNKVYQLYMGNLCMDYDKIVNNIDHKFDNPDYELFRNSIIIKYNNRKEYSSFIREHCLNRAIEVKNIFSIKYYTRELVDELASNAKYKDIYELLKKIDLKISIK